MAAPYRDPLNEKLRKLYDEANTVKQLIERDWSGATDMLRGQQLHPNRPRHKPPAVLNMLRPLAERKISMMTDTKPRMKVMATRAGTGYPNAARLLDEATNAWWDDFGMDMTLARGILQAITFGSLIVNTYWSPSRGDIVVDIVDPRNFYIDPYIVDPEQLSEAEYVIYEETPSLEAVKMRFGGKADGIKPWSVPLTEASTETWFTRMRSRFMTPFGRKAEESAIPRTLLRHYWLRDHSYVEVDVSSQDGKTHTVRRRKYPGGRYVIWAHDGIILHDEANPYYDLLHPFDMMSWYENTDTPWGDSEVFAQKNPQLLVNKLAEVITENTMLMGNAIWIADKTAFPADDGPDGWGQLTNVPGQVIKKRPGTEVRREYPQAVPNSAMNMLQHLEQFVESRAGGLPDLLTKGKAGNVQSGMGIEALQMTASAMIRLKARALESLIQRVGQKIISRMIQFYTQDRILHVLGPGNEFKEYTWVRKQFHDALGAEALKDAHRCFRFRVTPGSSLNMTRVQRALEAVQLYTLGCVDRQAVLDAVEFPNRDEVLKRTIIEQALGLEPGGQQKGKKSKRGYGPMERQSKTSGRM